ncbi:ABC transporter permease [Pigmentiphaga sp. H8]|uniref:ABC transporter permease n=1 Tax=unclassified Pigmentiphaga TaxID=2626614 RepID=UPI000F59AD0E|nr:ABC transporter permease [Pigmentiphaga sp. H8]AZG09903.1 ABC transporter permease [Pigmentiphaga sp. H8]
MLGFIVRRILSTLPVMGVVALLVFSLMYLAPGDPALLIAGDHASQEELDRIRVSLGLDEPFPIRFATWVWQLLHGALGTSIFTNLPVGTLLLERMEPTVSLMAVTLVIATSAGVPLGIAAAARADSWIDRLVMTGAVFGFSVPVFVLGYVLAYVFGLQLGILPVQGYRAFSEGLGPWLRSVLLPSFALSGVYVAIIARTTRAALLDVLQQGYIRTARAKGVGRVRILYVHALKNAALPIVTVIGIGMALLVSGAVVTESVFAIPGLGRLTADAILRRDYPVIQGVVLLFSFTYVMVNLLIDLVYILIDPRVRL